MTNETVVPDTFLFPRPSLNPGTCAGRLEAQRPARVPGLDVLAPGDCRPRQPTDSYSQISAGTNSLSIICSSLEMHSLFMLVWCSWASTRNAS
jgi:hypothetical protein